MLSGCEGDPSGIDGTIPLQDDALPRLASTIKENRNKVKNPVQNHLDATIQRQKKSCIENARIFNACVLWRTQSKGLGKHEATKTNFPHAKIY